MDNVGVFIAVMLVLAAIGVGVFVMTDVLDFQQREIQRRMRRYLDSLDDKDKW